MEAQSVKPKFDKKKWREKKYNNKVQVKQWEEKKKIILRSKLQRQLKKDPEKVVKSPHSSILKSQPEEDCTKHERLSRVKLAQVEYKKKHEEKLKLNKEKLKKKEGIAKAMDNYKVKKSENFRILSKKTKKGQPVMKGRMQLLFEQVKKSVGSTG